MKGVQESCGFRIGGASEPCKETDKRVYKMALNVTVQGPELPEGSKYPALVMMHFLGGSTREWDEVVALLGPEYKTVRIDLPGFGGSAGETGYGVAAMADAVHQAVCAAGVEEYVLVGHSMSGKVSMVLARQCAGCGVCACFGSTEYGAGFQVWGCVGWCWWLHRRRDRSR